jgi:acetoin utilization protein AcuB
MTRTILVEDYMTSSPHSIGVTLTISDARNLMLANGIRHLPVLDGGALVGVLSERDIQMIEAIEKKNAMRITVEEAMSQAPYTCSPTTPLEVAARHMAKHKLGSCVVMQGKKVVGVLTTTDGLRALAEVLEVNDRVPSRLVVALEKGQPQALLTRE